jgi:alpha-beta hydrolase superfamily lysophospholipase
MQQHAAEFPVPLLLVKGSADHIISSQAVDAFAKAVPTDKITYRVWEGLYHETHNEPEQQQVMEAMIAWVNHHI